MADPRRIHQASTSLLSIAMIVIGVLLLVRTLIAGGGALALGIVLGALFVAAGSARLWLQTRGGGGTGERGGRER